MGFILEKIEEAIKELLIGWIESNMTNMFTDVNDKVGTIAAEVGKTPSSWDSSIYQMIRGLSENVIVPIAGIIITFVLCYELISMITEKNNLHDMDTWMFFKWFFKAAVAIYLVTNTFDIVMAVFDIGQNVVTGAAGVISGDTNIDIESTLEQMRASMETMGIGELLGLSIETLLISLCLKIMSILITVILYGRMIEIYCTVSIAPIPIATMSNREWGSIGTNYLKGLFALAFQGFLIMVCVAIYAVLINNMIIAANIHSALFSVAAYTVILCFSLFKTGSLAKSLFNALCDSRVRLKIYSVIYAVPPWLYKVYSKKGLGRSAESHYPTMCLEDIKALPIGELAAKDCALFMWITFPCMQEALQVLEAWGFEYKTTAIVWIKQNRESDSLI